MSFAQNYLVLINITIILAVSFGILLLRKDKGVVRPQILLASLCSILLGLATILMVILVQMDFERHRQDPPEIHETPECAGVNPMQYCELPHVTGGYVSSPRITNLRDEKYPTDFSLSFAIYFFSLRFSILDALHADNHAAT